MGRRKRAWLILLGAVVIMSWVIIVDGDRIHHTSQIEELQGKIKELTAKIEELKNRFDNMPRWYRTK